MILTYIQMLAGIFKINWLNSLRANSEAHKRSDIPTKSGNTRHIASMCSGH
jgi:hypothetical protein